MNSFLRVKLGETLTFKEQIVPESNHIKNYMFMYMYIFWWEKIFIGQFFGGGPCLTEVSVYYKGVLIAKSVYTLSFYSVTI